MHTVKVIAGGFLLLTICLLIGRVVGGAGAHLGTTAKLFLPLWLVVAAVSMWIGVSKAPAAVAIIVMRVRSGALPVPPLVAGPDPAVAEVVAC
jgi:hypothetical protein